MKELVVFLYGGLGNQIFQYAYARKIADDNGFNLVLNTYGFDIDNYYKRNLELLNFGVIYDKIEKNDKLYFQLSRIIQHFPILNSILNLFLPNLIIENTNKFERNKLNLKSYIKRHYLFGYWHDERYFSDNSVSLKKSFSKIFNLSDKNIEFEKILKFNKSVSVHIRLTHMLKHNSKDNGITKYQLNIEYYTKAFKYISNILGDCTFYVFSDKPILAKEFLNSFDYQFIILENDRGFDYEDVYLMSKFKYHIIANSSFSWWGAWLSDNSNNNNITIAPHKTLFTPSIPKRWITLN